MPTIPRTRKSRNGSASKEGRYDGRVKVTFRLPEPIASSLARTARQRKSDKSFPWEKQDIVEECLRSWFKAYRVAVKA